ncbi:MAG: hypothetical protein AAB349_03100, partial [Chloroflexota bacterium]
MRQEFNVSKSLDLAYRNAMVALHYANLLARHAYDAQPRLDVEPVNNTVALDFRTNNPDVAPQARAQFPDEVCRYALIYALAHFDRFVLEVGVLEALVEQFVARGGTITMEQALATEKRARKIKGNRSVAAELNKLGGSTSSDVATGIRWFQGLYAIRTWLVHRAGIVGPEDKRLV